MKITTICSIFFMILFYSTKYFLVNKPQIFVNSIFKAVIRFEGVSKIYSTDVVL